MAYGRKLEGEARAQLHGLRFVPGSEFYGSVQVEHVAMTVEDAAAVLAWVRAMLDKPLIGTPIPFSSVVDDVTLAEGIDNDNRTRPVAGQE